MWSWSPLLFTCSRASRAPRAKFGTEFGPNRKMNPEHGAVFLQRQNSVTMVQFKVHSIFVLSVLGTGIRNTSSDLSDHYFRRLQKYWKSRGIPGPDATFVLGNCHLFDKNKEVEPLQLQKWTEEFGTTYGILDGSRKTLVTSDMDFLQEVFVKQSDIFHGRRVSVFL